MKNRIIGLTLFTLIVFAFACKKDDENVDNQPAIFAMTFDLSNGEDLTDLNTKFTTPEGYPASVENIRFYLSNIRLINSSGEKIALSEIAFFDFKNQISPGDFSIPVGSYDSIAFDLGVPANLNSPENPDFLVSAYDNNHPLSESNGMFWGWEAGYRFFTIDGYFDTVPNTNDILPLSFSMHSGRDTLYRKVPAFYYPFVVTSDQKVTAPFVLNLGTFFANGEERIDLKYESQYHGSLSLMPLGIKLADNSAACIYLMY